METSLKINCFQNSIIHLCKSTNHGKNPLNLQTKAQTNLFYSLMDSWTRGIMGDGDS